MVYLFQLAVFTATLLPQCSLAHPISLLEERNGVTTSSGGEKFEPVASSSRLEKRDPMFKVSITPPKGLPMEHPVAPLPKAPVRPRPPPIKNPIKPQPNRLAVPPAGVRMVPDIHPVQARPQSNPPAPVAWRVTSSETRGRFTMENLEPVMHPAPLRAPSAAAGKAPQPVRPLVGPQPIRPQPVRPQPVQQQPVKPIARLPVIHEQRALQVVKTEQRGRFTLEHLEPVPRPMGAPIAPVRAPAGRIAQPIKAPGAPAGNMPQPIKPIAKSPAPPPAEPGMRVVKTEQRGRFTLEHLEPEPQPVRIPDARPAIVRHPSGATGKPPQPQALARPPPPPAQIQPAPPGWRVVGSENRGRFAMEHLEPVPQPISPQPQRLAADSASQGWKVTGSETRGRFTMENLEPAK